MRDWIKPILIFQLLNCSLFLIIIILEQNPTFLNGDWIHSNLKNYIIEHITLCQPLYSLFWNYAGFDILNFFFLSFFLSFFFISLFLSFFLSFYISFYLFTFLSLFCSFFLTHLFFNVFHQMFFLPFYFILSLI